MNIYGEKQHRDLTVVDWSSTESESSLSCHIHNTYLTMMVAVKKCLKKIWQLKNTSINKSFLVIIPITREARGTTNICLSPSWRKRL